MAIWTEMRCDNRSGSVSDCYSHQNAGPKTMAGNDAKSVAAARSDLVREALEGGWKRDGVDLLCPACSDARAKISDKCTEKGEV
jgi:hypothetical protein